MRTIKISEAIKKVEFNLPRVDSIKTNKYVILYFPDTTENYNKAIPLNYYHLGGMLEKYNIPYKIIDARVDQNPHQMLLDELPNALLVGISSLTGHQINDAVAASRLVKSNSDVHTVWGGWHVSILPKQSLSADYVDFIIRKQGESALIMLIDHLVNSTIQLCDIPSLGYKLEDGVCRLNELGPIEDPNELPMPAFHHFDPKKYPGRPVEKGGVYINYQSSIGCPYNCAFCASPLVYQRRWKAISPKRMLDEIESLIEKYGVTDIGFTDENFFVDVERCREFFKGVVERKLKFYWYASIRIEILRKLDDEMLELLQKSNCYILHPGVEATSEDLLKVINKKFTMDDVLYCAKRLKKYGIKGLFGFIVCFPSEEDEHVDTTFEMLKSLKKIDPDMILPVNFYTPYPGNPLYEDAKDKGFSEPKVLEEWGNFSIRQGVTPWISEDKRQKILMFDKYTLPAAIPSVVMKKKMRSLRTCIIYWPLHLMAKFRLKHGYFPLDLDWKALYTYWKFWEKNNKKYKFLHNINFRW